MLGNAFLGKCLLGVDAPSEKVKPLTAASVGTKRGEIGHDCHGLTYGPTFH